MEWLQHAARTQAHKFLTGVAPIRSVVRVGGAVAGLLAVPAAHISGAVARRGCSSLAAAAASAGNSSASDALRKSTVSFVRALVFEALGLGATVAAGAQVVLAGGLPVAMEAPSGFMEGLRAAAGELKGGLGVAADALVRGPVRSMREGGATWQQAASRALRAAPAAAGTSAQAAAAAVRYTLLGVQCALDPDKRLEQ
jgi:autophagy-related protein 2